MKEKKAIDNETDKEMNERIKETKKEKSISLLAEDKLSGRTVTSVYILQVHAGLIYIYIK
jgi:hypothetical protein